MRLPKELKYTQTHEWVRFEEDGLLTVGLSDYAQAQLGELVFVDLPDIDIRVQANDEVGTVESVKAASDVYSPVSGKIVEVNEDLAESPSLVNSDPYHDGWLFKINPEDTEELNDLMDQEAYESHLEEDEE